MIPFLVSDFMQYWAEMQVTQIIEEKDHVDKRCDSMDKRHESIDGIMDCKDDNHTNKLSTMLLSIDMEEVNWDKWTAIVFFLGSSLSLFQAYLDWKHPTIYYYQALDILTSTLFVVDSIICLIGWAVARKVNLNTVEERL